MGKRRKTAPVQNPNYNLSPTRTSPFRLIPTTAAAARAPLTLFQALDVSRKCSEIAVINGETEAISRYTNPDSL